MKTLIDPAAGNDWSNLTPQFQAFLTHEHAEISDMAKRLGITIAEATQARLDAYEMGRSNG